MRFRLVLGALTGAWLVAAVACGARSELPIPNRGPAVMNEGGGPPECVVFNSSTELAPLDVFVMLDRSGSMDAPTGSGTAKWWAVRDALDAFFKDPESRGINVALSFFPIIQEQIPELCNGDPTCGEANACKPLLTCPTTLSICQSDADCEAEGNGDSCVPLGRCEMQQVQFCTEVEQPCPGAIGPCIPVGFCENRFTCDSSFYEPPAVDLGLLPDHGFNLLNQFNMIGPDGGTPTLPALTGVVDRATEHGMENPGNNVIVVLATDGVPTACDDAIDQMDEMQALQNLTDAAARGAQAGVATFVIGVFSPEEEAAAAPSLQAIAEAGGSVEPFIVDSAGGVSDDFREALNQVRVSAKSCEFELVDSGDPIDYEDVWVRITRGEDEVWIRRVDDLASCDPFDGGFFYDQPVPGPTPPSTVRLCPATCQLLGSSPDRTVEIFTTCGPGEG